MRRKGMMLSKGSGYRNVIPHYDSHRHALNAKGQKMPQHLHPMCGGKLSSEERKEARHYALLRQAQYKRGGKDTQFVFDADNLESIQRAERRKARLENQGYNFSGITRLGLNKYRMTYEKGGKVPFSTKGINIFDLPIENAVYVPSTDKTQNQIPEKAFRKRISDTENELSRLFGGFTRFNDYGGYKSDSGQVVREKGARVASFATAKDAKDPEKLNNLKKWLVKKQKQWGQETIGYENEGDLHYISKS
jgi:hypothetical protein